MIGYRRVFGHNNCFIWPYTNSLISKSVLTEWNKPGEECAVSVGNVVVHEIGKYVWRLWEIIICWLETFRIFFFLWRCSPTRAMTSSFLMRFLDHTQRRNTVGRTPLDEWPARRKDIYMTAHNTHNRQTSMPPMGFEPTISVDERPQTYVLDRAATGIGVPNK